MRETILTVTKKGQVTIPKEARQHLGVAEKGKNRRVALILESDGSVRLTKTRYPDISSVRGAAGKLKRPVPWEQIRSIAYEDHKKNKFKQHK